MRTLNQVLDILRQFKPELQKKYPITRMGVFGSYARGEATRDSDVDIAVDIDGTMGLNFVAMAEDIEHILNMKVDVVPKRAIKAHYLPTVEKDIIYV